MEEVHGSNKYSPEKEIEGIETPDDWQGASLIFATALGMFMEGGTGIIVQLDDSMLNVVKGAGGKFGKVLVYKQDNKIYVTDLSQDMPNGQRVTLKYSDPKDPDLDLSDLNVEDVFPNNILPNV